LLSGFDLFCEEEKERRVRWRDGVVGADTLQCIN